MKPTILEKLANPDIYNQLGFCLTMLVGIPRDQLYATATVLRCNGNEVYASMVEDVVRWQKMLSPEVIEHPSRRRRRRPRERL